MTAAEWDAWLATPECFGILEAAARIVLRQAERIGLPDGLLPCEHLPDLRGVQREDCVRAVAHDLWIFLRTRPDTWKARTDLRWSAAQGESFLIRRIGQDYLRQLKDQARTYGSHPGRALYRRVRQVLQEDEAIHYRATAQGAFFSLEPGSPEMNDLLALRTVPYEQWDSPLEAVPAADLHRRESLIRLARLFWKQAAERMGGVGHALPVRELVHYLTRHYAHLGAPMVVSEGRSGTPGGVDEIESVPMPGAERAPELSVVRSRLDELARKLTASWPENQRKAFALIHGDELTLEAAAARMGYKGASGVRYVYRAALDRLRDFCLLWPGLSPPDLDEELFDEFMDLVLAICKRGG